MVRVQVCLVVHCRRGCCMVQQPLIRRGTAAAADGAGPSTKGNPRMGGGILVRVRLAPALLVGLMLMIMMVVVVCPKEGLLILAEPGDSTVCRLLAQWLLGDNSRAVDVVVFHVGRLYLINGVYGGRMLKTSVGHSTVQ